MIVSQMIVFDKKLKNFSKPFSVNYDEYKAVFFSFVKSILELDF